jgi:hypothetical protein
MKKTIIYTAIAAAALMFTANNALILHSAEEEQHHDDAHHEGEEGHDHEAHDKMYGGKIGNYEVSIKQHGEISAGGEAHLDIVLSGSKKAPKALRLWVGVKSAKGSMKARAGKGHSPGEYHVEVEVPEKIPENSKLWVEIHDSAGRKKGGFDLK